MYDEVVTKRKAHMPVLLLVMSLGLPAAAQTKRPELKLKALDPGKFRILETYPSERRPDGFLDFDFMVLDTTRPLRFAAGGPGTVLLVVRGFEFGEVTFKLFCAEKSDELALKLTPLLSLPVPIRIPSGTRAITLTPSSRVMVRLVEGHPTPLEKRAPAEVKPVKHKKPSPFWKYQPDRLGLAGPEEPREKSRLGFWATAGVGGGAQLDPALGGWVFGATVNLRIDSLVLQLRTSLVNEMEEQETGPWPSEFVWEVGALAGMGLRGSWGWLAGTAGIGIVGGDRRGEFLRTDEEMLRDIHERIDLLGVGFPLDLQVFFTPFSCLGIGIEVIANLNFERSFFGVLLAVQLGEI